MLFHSSAVIHSLQNSLRFATLHQSLGDFLSTRKWSSFLSGFMFYCRFFFATGSPRCIGRLARNFSPWPLVNWLLRLCSEILGAFHQKISGAKNMQNLALFRMNSHFDGKRNGWRYFKSDKYLIYHDSSRIRWNKLVNFGPLLWRSKTKSYPPKSTFSGDHILAHKGCCMPKFLHSLAND